MGDYKYKAFISYSHKDRKWTRWLHRRLETYPIPKNIIGNVTPAGIIPKRLKPIFRDREELSASNNLGEKIEAALASSQSLIIICSPAAAKSKWVNQEILTFKRNNRDAQLFSVIVEGEPYASTMPGRETEECFPPALRYEVNPDGTLSDMPAEPLAADLRPHADGKRLGALKLISGMIGVGLDEVVQRDMKRSRKRVTAITTGSLATVLAMGTLTGFALDARQEAEEAQLEAEAGRNDAEESIEFMLTDLKPELEKVGRLNALSVIGQRAEAYYDKYPASKHSDEALGRRARVFHFLGEILDKEGELDLANTYFQQAYEATSLLLQRNPTNTDRIYEHAQSAFWAGYVPFRKGDLLQTEHRFKEYNQLAKKLTDLRPENLRFQNELVSTYVNLGSFYIKQESHLEALQNFERALAKYETLMSGSQTDSNIVRNYTDTLGWTAKTLTFLERYEDAKNYRKKEMYNACKLLGINETMPWELIDKVKISDWQSLYILASSQRNLAKLEFYQKNYASAETEAKYAEILFEKLVKNDPSNKQWTEGYAYSQVLRVHSLLKLGLISDAEMVRRDLDVTLSKYENLINQTEINLVSKMNL